MKIKYLLSFAAAFALCQFALAKMPFSNDMFGRVEGTMDFCAQIDHASADKYETRKKEAVKGATDSEIADARNSGEYKAGYKEMSEQLAQMPKDEVMQACTAALQEKK
jgi:hypothetical protein